MKSSSERPGERGCVSAPSASLGALTQPRSRGADATPLASSSRGAAATPLTWRLLLVIRHRTGDAHDAAGDAVAGISGRLALQIVGLGVNNDGAANDRARTTQGDLLIPHVDHGNPSAVGGDVAEVADVTLRVLRAAVLLLVGIEMPAVTLRIAGGAIAELVDVESMLAGLESADLATDLDALVRHGEADDAFGGRLAEAVDDRDGLLDTRSGHLLDDLSFYRGATEQHDRHPQRQQSNDELLHGKPFLRGPNKLNRANVRSCYEFGWACASLR